MQNGLRKTDLVISTLNPQICRQAGTDIPNITAYALQTNNPLKTQLYDRDPFASENVPWQLNAYPSPESARSLSLKGRSKADRYGLDPDGDGFACTWDPTPFRLARSEMIFCAKHFPSRNHGERRDVTTPIDYLHYTAMSGRRLLWRGCVLGA